MATALNEVIAEAAALITRGSGAQQVPQGKQGRLSLPSGSSARSFQAVILSPACPSWDRRGGTLRQWLWGGQLSPGSSGCTFSLPGQGSAPTPLGSSSCAAPGSSAAVSAP